MTEKRWLVLSAQQITLGLLPKERGVVLHLDLAESSAGLVPELDLVIRLTAAESRMIARALLQKADEAEGE